MNPATAGTGEPARSHADAALRTGLLAGTAAYALWGLFPLYFHALEPTGPIEVLCHRIVWTLLWVSIPAWRLYRGELRSVLDDPARRGRLAVAGVLVATNWLVYIWAVQHDLVVDAALGYFINPLVTVMIGVLVLHERLRRLQWAACVSGAAAVVVLVVAYGRVPWVSLALAVTFAAYGYLKKTVPTHPLVSLTVETLTLTPVATIAAVVIAIGPGLDFGHSIPHSGLLLLAGPITAVPLLLFAAAAPRIPLSLLGLLQYLTPTMQFVLGVAVFHESVPPARLAGFVLVWLALALLSVDAVRAARRVRPARP